MIGFLPSLINHKFFSQDFGAEASEFRQQYENVIAYLAKETDSQEMQKAKEGFLLASGKVFSDDPMYEKRIDYFLNHFFFEEKIDGISRAQKIFANSDYLTKHSLDCDRFLQHNHSLFRVVSVRDEKMIAIDLLSQTQMLVKIATCPPFLFKGIARNDLFQGYLFKRSEGLYFALDIPVIHPRKVNKTILTLRKKCLRTETVRKLEILIFLALQQIRFVRHTHVDPKKIYSSIPKPPTTLTLAKPH